MSSIDIKQIGDTQIAWDSDGCIYHLENTRESRSIGYCIRVDCRALLYVAREADLCLGYLLTTHKCFSEAEPEDVEAQPLTCEEQKERTADKKVQTEAHVEKFADTAVQATEDNTKKQSKCLFNVEIVGNYAENRSFHVVKSYPVPTLLVNAIGEAVCLPTAPNCFIEVGRWDEEYQVYSQMTDDEILSARCANGERYNVICHVEDPERSTMKGWMVRICDSTDQDSGSILKDTSSIGPNSSTTSIFTDADSESSDFDYGSSRSTMPYRSYSMPQLVGYPVYPQLEQQGTLSKNESILEAAFVKNPFLDSYTLIDLAISMDMSLAEVREWFEKRRSKATASKRQSTSC